MLATLWSLRWLKLTALALAAIVICVVASLWQYHRTTDQLAIDRAAVADAADYAAVVTGDDLGPQSLGRAVTMSGRYVPGARSFVRSRVGAAGEPGYLVLDGLALPDGRVVAVLQGWVADTADAAPAATGSVSVSGRVQPDENFYADAPVSPTGPLVTITAAGLREQWSDLPGVAGRLAPGYVTADSPTAVFERSAAVFGADPDVPFPLQNVFYSLQWLVFAALVLLAWMRGLWLESRPAEPQLPLTNDRPSQRQS